MTTMEAIVFDAKAKELCLSEVAVPSPPAKDEVLVEVAYAGVCGTDLHIIAGHMPCKEDAPVVLGHEFSGVAKEVGSGVSHIRRGDRVVVDPNHGCFVCEFCTRGDVHLCQAPANTVGIMQDGGWARFCKVPASVVYRLPDRLSLRVGALAEPMSCLSHGWDRVLPVAMGSRILVQGAGVIGALWVSTLHHLGHRCLVLSDPNQSRRDIIKALDLGVEVLHPSEIAKAYSGEVDVCIDCSGSAAAMETAVSILRPGGKLLVFGVADPKARMSISPFDVYKKELTILGVMVNPFSFNKSIGFLESMNEKYLSFEKLGVGEFQLSQYAEALQKLRERAVSKAVFRVSPPSLGASVASVKLD
ncbi:hypothetical protein ONE63_003834 [Megalurothrips usitatus]|uniref:Enoyl reductase (ER) domain-containing protein n=1 Tax=Megalurothrips usitatus TaxID=439358 RepID=A0AAV7XA92_9NEOP|nr:hypothetical protein ONE63_003834 [Megalurothrips usitatus]